MTTRPVAVAFAGRNVVDLAIAPSGTAIISSAVILGVALGCRARETPDVLSLPGSTAFVRTPRAATNARYHSVAPLTQTDLAMPLRKVAGNPAVFERRALLGLSGHWRALCARHRASYFNKKDKHTHERIIAGGRIADVYKRLHSQVV